MIHTRDHQTSYLLVPSDPDATYDGHKGQGYQVQVMETCCDAEDDEKREQTLNLITHVAVERACKHDVHALIPALESARERDLAPPRLLAPGPFSFEQRRSRDVPAYAAPHYRGALMPLDKLSFAARFGNALISYVKHMGKMFLSFSLSVFYPLP